MFGGDDLPFSRHSDVLHAAPASDDEVTRLVEELKRRGNAAFQQKAFEEAEVLYSKAIDVNASNPLRNQHIFYANRSASRASMGKASQALEDAEACIALESEYAKGYFRKAQALKALKKYKDALAALQTAKALEPENKSLATLEKQLTELAANHVEQAPAPKPVEKKVTRIEVAKDDDSAAAPRATSANKIIVDDEEIVGHVRGYKKTADGRTTTFFNNELTEEAKRLIGDIAPKKVDDPNKVQIKSVDGGSAWNVGNTFEEKDMTSWAKSKLESVLANLSAPLHANGTGLVRVTEVKDIAGDASIAVVRGKKRYIFDFTFSLAVVGEADDVPVVGELKFLDLSSDADGDYDVDVSVPSRYASDVGKALHGALSSAASPFRAIVAKQLSEFVKEYQTF